jgi:hypothetical protein
VYEDDDDYFLAGLMPVWSDCHLTINFIPMNNGLGRFFGQDFLEYVSGAYVRNDAGLRYLKEFSRLSFLQIGDL